MNKNSAISDFLGSKSFWAAITVILTIFLLCGLTIADSSKNNNKGSEARAQAIALSEERMKKIAINEVCSQGYYDSYDATGQKYDYIELYNPNEDPIFVSDLYLSDDKTDLWKCRVLSTNYFEGNGYLTLFASGLSTSRATAKSNLNFKVSAGETIFLSHKGQIIDSVVVPELEFEKVYARSVDGVGEFKISAGSPNATNNNVNFVEKPIFSAESGFYDGDFTLEINAEVGCEIYYTLDSSVPTVNSQKYNKPLTITDASLNENVYSAITNIVPANVTYSPPDHLVDKATIVRAIAVDKQGNISSAATSSYFVGFQNKEGYQGVKVLSLVVEPDDMFGDENGIYVTGAKYDEEAGKIIEEYNAQEESQYDKNVERIALSSFISKIRYLANYMRSGIKSEKYALFDVYSEEKELSFSQVCGVRTHGNTSRDNPKKRLKIFPRKIYDGIGVFPRDLMGNSIEYEQSVMLLDASNFRGFFSNLLVNDRAIATQDFKLYQVFFNGEYFGAYNITERYTTEYINKHYGVNKDNIVVTSGSDITAINMSLSCDEPHLYAKNNNLSTPNHYEAISEMMDIQSFIDWICTTVYINDKDTTESVNLQMWRSIDSTNESPYADGKWRWMLYDTDSSLSSAYDYDSFSEALHWSGVSIMDGVLFSNLLHNDVFRKQFTLTFMDMSNYNFQAERVSVLIDEVYNTYYAANKVDKMRWNAINFESQINSAKWFFNNRFDYIVKCLATNMKLTGKLVNVTIAVSNPSGGDITLNTITPELEDGKWSGKYYTDYPVTVTANPKSGYKFVRWETTGGGKIEGSASEKSVSVSLSGDTTVTAVFEPA